MQIEEISKYNNVTFEGPFSAGWLAGKPDYTQKLKVPEGYEKSNENRNGCIDAKFCKQIIV